MDIVAFSFVFSIKLLNSFKGMSSKWKVGKLKFKEGAPKPAYIPKKARKNEDKEE
jgi:hypothetical protein